MWKDVTRRSVNAEAEGIRGRRLRAWSHAGAAAAPFPRSELGRELARSAAVGDEVTIAGRSDLWLASGPAPDLLCASGGKPSR